MNRLIALTLFCLAASPAIAETVPTLKEKVSVSGETVTLNDLLNKPVEKGNAAVFAAPQPGEEGTISAIRVIDAARSYGIEKIPVPEWKMIQIKREARTIRHDDIRDAIRERVVRDLHINPETIDVSINRDVSDLSIEKNADGPLQFSYFRFDQNSGRFDAYMYVPGSTIAGEGSPIVVAGSAHEMTDVVQMKANLTRGQRISKSDVTLARMKKQLAGGNVLHSIEDAVGMLAKRSLAEGVTLRGNDIEKPRLVARNDMVLIMYQTPAMVVTARGKAMTDGAMGDTVEIQNLQSKRSLTATVTGDGQVTVTTLMPRRVAQISTPEQ